MRLCAFLRELVLHSYRAPYSLLFHAILFIRSLLTPISSLQAFDIDLGHLQHGFENPYFRLPLAVHKERYGWRKRVVRATVQRHEFLPFELESHSHHGSSRAETRFSVTRNVQDF